MNNRLGSQFGTVMAVVFVFSLVLIGLLLVAAWDQPSEPRIQTVELVSDGEPVGTAAVEVASTDEELRRGLSEYDSLAPGEGMLFVFQAFGKRKIVMREMDFGVDIVFVGADCVITSIHSAPQPGPNESGTEAHHQYHGEGKFVLEVPYGYTNQRVAVGDTVLISSACQRNL